MAALLIIASSALLTCEGAAQAGPGKPEYPPGTRITASKTAVANVLRQEKYTWTLTESLLVPNQVTLVIPEGQSAAVGFNLVATRLGPEILDSESTVSGEVCVNNTGRVRTEGLRIRDQIEQEVSPGVWQAIANFSIPVSSELRPFSRRCYPYQLDLSLDPQAQYRNKAIITIDNYAGYEGRPRSIAVVTTIDVNFSISTVDATASVSDPFSCPPGFSCELSGTVSTVNNSATVPFTVILSNISAPCGQTVTASDTGTLVPSDTQVPITAYAAVNVYTGTCRPDSRRGGSQ